MTVKTDLKLQLFAGDVLVAESADKLLWQDVLSTITQAEAEPSAKKGLRLHVKREESGGGDGGGGGEVRCRLASPRSDAHRTSLRFWYSTNRGQVGRADWKRWKRGSSRF